MMKTYRSSRTRARAGSIVAAALVGGGLMLTASNGIAAETSKQVEEQVREVLAPVVPAIAPVPPVAPPAVAAVPTAPSPVKLAMAGHPHPLPPPPSIVPVPPVPPMPPMVDGEEISREVREAVEEARRDALEAQREAASARRDALLEAAEARREAMREAEEGRREAERGRREAVRAAAYARSSSDSVRAHVLAARQMCSRGTHNVSVELVHDGKKQVVQCQAWSPAQRAEMRKSMLAGLQSARASIASMDARHMPTYAREQALESIDRQIERLRESN